MSIAAVVLAAGFSRRLGRPKQALVLGGETLVARAARIAQEAGLAPVIIVVNPHLGFADALQPGCTVVTNEHAAEGMASSIRCGIAAAKLLEPEGAVLITCDQVAVRPKHLRSLYEDVSTITGSGYAGKVGVPAYFPAAAFDGLLRLQGDVGARELLRGARVVETEALGFDIDTKEDLARAEVFFERGLRR